MGCQAGRCYLQSRGWIAIMEDSKHGGLGCSTECAQRRFAQLLPKQTLPFCNHTRSCGPCREPNLLLGCLEDFGAECWSTRDTILEKFGRGAGLDFEFWMFLTAQFCLQVWGLEPLGLIRKTYKGLLHRFPNPYMAGLAHSMENQQLCYLVFEKISIHKPSQRYCKSKRWNIGAPSQTKSWRLQLTTRRTVQMLKQSRARDDEPRKGQEKQKKLHTWFENSPAKLMYDAYSYLFLLGRAGWMRSHPQSRKAWNWSLPTWSMSFDFQRFRDDCTTVPAHNR